MPGAAFRSEVPLASALLKGTVLPHHVASVFTPISPFFGYCRQKKIMTAETATPESSAADKMSYVTKT